MAEPALPQPPRRPVDLLHRRDEVLGYVVTSLDEGRCRVSWQPPGRLANPAGFVHGGYVAMIVDNAAGLAVTSLLDEVFAFPTVSLHVDYLRGLHVERAYDVSGVVVRAGRRVTVADAQVRDDAGRLLARGSCTFALDLADDVAGFAGLDAEDG